MSNSAKMMIGNVGDSTTTPQPNNTYNSPIDVPAGLAAVEGERLPQHIVEPACGGGTISLALGATSRKIESSDLLTNAGFGYGGRDYFARTVPLKAMVTNPPFDKFVEFVEHSANLGAEYIAMLGKTRYLEGQARTRVMEQIGLTRVWVYDYRVKFIVQGKPRNLFSFAWFVFDLRNPPKDGEMWSGGWIRRHHVQEWIDKYGTAYEEAVELNRSLRAGRLTADLKIGHSPISPLVETITIDEAIAINEAITSSDKE